MCTARLFSQAEDLFALKFYLDMVVLHQPFLANRKLETLGYPMVKTVHSLVLTQYRSVTDGRTDRQTHMLPQLIMRPSIARANGQLDSQCS